MNPLYLRITHANGYIKEINENKYLVFDLVFDLKNTMMLLMELWVILKK